MSPERSDLVLSSDIPHGELDVLVLDRLDVEATGWLGVESLISFSAPMPSESMLEAKVFGE